MALKFGEIYLRCFQEDADNPNARRISLGSLLFSLLGRGSLRIPCCVRSDSGSMLQCGLGSALSHLKSSIWSH
jgi:hypothetical protein